MKKNSTPLYSIRVILFPIVKRGIDIFSSVFLLILFSPIMLVTAIFVYFTSKNSLVKKYPQLNHQDNFIDNIFFKQKRVGQNHEFYMYKFHSMYICDNDKFLQTEYPALWKKYKQNDWKLSANEDPRITPIGKFIRKTSIDEMPQFFNVLKGEMSLVGPRAYRDAELKEYSQKYPATKEYIADIRSVKPGITGPWQVSGRNELPFEKRAKLDSEYIRNRSIFQEIIIILKTPAAMLSIW
jgi:exopolysaccharide production protein ExoY